MRRSRRSGMAGMSEQDKTVDLIHQLRSRCQYCTCVGCRCDHKGIEEQAANALEAQARRLDALKAGARKQHDLLTSIVRRLREIDIIGDSPNANITGAIHGVIDGYVNWRAEAKALAPRLKQAEAIATEALNEWDYASHYKSTRIREKHGDAERIEERRAELRALGEDRT